MLAIVAAAAVAVVVGATAAVLVIDGGGGTRGRGPRAVVAPGPAEVGAPAPDFVLPGIEPGRAVRLADLRGRPVVVNFWASWCHPCREEFPLLRGALAEHRNADLVVVGISYRDIAADARRFAAAQRATWPLVRDPGGAAARAYGVRAVPQTFFVAADGTLADRRFGIATRDDLEAGLATILPDPGRH